MARAACGSFSSTAGCSGSIILILIGSCMSNCGKFLGVVCGALSFVSIGWTQPATDISSRAFIDRYCAGCHNDRAKIGGLSLQKLNPEDPGAAPEVWENVVRKLRVRYMPPAGVPKPDDRAYNTVVARLESQ